MKIEGVIPQDIREQAEEQKKLIEERLKGERYIQKVREDQDELLQKQLTSYQELALQGAKLIEDTFGNVLFNAMQGQFDNIGEGFKQTVDRMVADFLKSQLFRLLFGQSFMEGKTGDVGGWIGKGVVGLSKLLSFDSGGVVPGMSHEEMPIIAHGRYRDWETQFIS